MGIFAHHKGLVSDLLSVLAQIIRIEVAVVPNATIPTVTVVERRTGAVEFTYLIIHCLDVRTYPTLIAKTPEDNTGMIEVALHE